MAAMNGEHAGPLQSNLRCIAGCHANADQQIWTSGMRTQSEGKSMLARRACDTWQWVFPVVKKVPGEVRVVSRSSLLRLEPQP